jgi:hypothetical protein
LKCSGATLKIHNFFPQLFLLFKILKSVVKGALLSNIIKEESDETKICVKTEPKPSRHELLASWALWKWT